VSEPDLDKPIGTDDIHDVFAEAAQRAGGTPSPPGGSPFTWTRENYTIVGNAFTPRKGSPAVRLLVRPAETPRVTPVGDEASYREPPELFDPSDIDFVNLSRETGADRRGKRLGISREHQTGDPTFDDEVYVDSNAPDGLLRHILASAELRRAVLSLFEVYTGTIELFPVIHRRSLIVITLRKPTRAVLDPERLGTMVDALGAIAAGLPYDGVNPKTENRPSCFGCIGIALLLCIVVFTGALAFIVLLVLAFSGWDIVGHGHLLIGAGAGLLLWLVLVFVSYAFVKGRSSSHRTFGCLATCLLPLGVLGGMAGLNAINCALDESPDIEQHVEVLSKQTRAGRSTTYFARIESWREGEDERSLRIPRRVYEQIEQGSVLVVHVHEGVLGWEWISSISIDQSSGDALDRPER